MLTIHIGWAASLAATTSTVDSKTAGTVGFAIGLRYVTNNKNERIAISRSGEILVYDDKGRERERHKIPYGATISVGDGENIEAGQRIASWDPLTRPIVSEYAGTVRFENKIGR